MRSCIKKIVFFLLDLAGADKVLLGLKQKCATIVLYHGVAPENVGSGIYNYRRKFIHQDSFEKHLEWYKKHFDIVPLSTLLEHIETGKRFPKRTLSITFDDGYENLYSYALPLLKKFKIPATVFITTNLIESKKPLWFDALEYAIGHTKRTSLPIEINGGLRDFSLDSFEDRCRADSIIRNHLKTLPQKKFLSLLNKVLQATREDLTSVFLESPYRGLKWDQIREMQKNGIAFMPHTVSHPILSSLSGKDAKKEITDSLEILQSGLGQKPMTVFAYPNGQPRDFTEETISLVKKLGFTAALTTTPGNLCRRYKELFSIPRISMDGSDDIRFFRLTASGVRKILQNIKIQ